MVEGKKREGQEDEGKKERLTKGQDAEEEAEGERGCPISSPTRETYIGKGGMEIEELEKKGVGKRKKLSEAGQLVKKGRKQGPRTKITKDGANATTQEDELGSPSLISTTKRIHAGYQIIKAGLECLVPVKNIVLLDEMPLWSQLEGGDDRGFMKKLEEKDDTWIRNTVFKLYYNASHFRNKGLSCTAEAEVKSNKSIMSTLI